MFEQRLGTSLTHEIVFEMKRSCQAIHNFQHLPLQEKKVWFTATCSHYPTGTISSENGYVIEVSQGMCQLFFISYSSENEAKEILNTSAFIRSIRRPDDTACHQTAWGLRLNCIIPSTFIAHLFVPMSIYDKIFLCSVFASISTVYWGLLIFLPLTRIG